MIDIRSLPFSLLSLALITSHHISARVGKSQRVVEAVGVSVVGLGVFRVLYHNIWREHPANKRVIHSAVHVNQAEVVVVFVYIFCCFNHCIFIFKNKSSELKVSASTTKIFSQRQNMFLTNQSGFKESVFCRPSSVQQKISIPLYLSLSGKS